jgi:hypothetical protein
MNINGMQGLRKSLETIKTWHGGKTRADVTSEIQVQKCLNTGFSLLS